MIASCHDLRVEYKVGDERLTVLDIPYWSLEKGEQAVLAGPSGSGKSTLLHVLAGLLPPATGEVVVEGTDLYALGEAERDRFRARCLACVFQTFNLLQAYNALENVSLGIMMDGAPRGGAHRPTRAETAETARSLLVRVGLGHRLLHRPSQMSVGEQQRVAIARAFAKKPGLILADEPTGSLDPRNKRAVLRLLRDLCQELGCALLVVSHEEDVVRSFDHKVDFAALNRICQAAGPEDG